MGRATTRQAKLFEYVHAFLQSVPNLRLKLSARNLLPTAKHSPRTRSITTSQPPYKMGGFAFSGDLGAVTSPNPLQKTECVLNEKQLNQRTGLNATSQPTLATRSTIYNVARNATPCCKTFTLLLHTTALNLKHKQTRGVFNVRIRKGHSCHAYRACRVACMAAAQGGFLPPAKSPRTLGQKTQLKATQTKAAAFWATAYFFTLQFRLTKPQRHKHKQKHKRHKSHSATHNRLKQHAETTR